MTDDPASPTSPTGHAARDLATLAERFWDGEMAAEPLAATALGDRRFDDRLRPNGPGARDAALERLRSVLDDAQAIPAADLGPRDRTTLDELITVAGAELDAIGTGIQEWMVDPLDGPQVIFQNVPSFQPIRTASEARALLARWEEMGPWIDRLTASSREALGDGVGAPAALARSVVDEIDELLARPVAEWPLSAPAGELPADIPAPERQRLSDAILAAVADGVRPALDRYRGFLAGQLGPVARGDDRPGLSHVPGGEAAYAALVRYHTTLALGPEEIHRIGLTETERIDGEFRELGARLLGSADLATVLSRLRGDPALHFATAREVFDVAQDTLDRANAAIPGWFGRLPKAPCLVVEMGAHEAEHSTIAYYRQPAADGSRPGSYYINTTKPQTRPRYEAETLAVHEAVPGHHLQIAIAQELEGLPAFRRLGGHTAYVEGWGLYTERLSVEMGLISAGVAQLGVVSFDAWRACRLVVDTGMHALGWSRDQAIQFMVEHTALAENNIVNEVDRYLAIPAQALAYKIGQREILRLRDRARAALGSRFDIRGFHDAVLGQGAVGLATLGRIVDDWIAAQAAATGRPAMAGG
ncbi:MAG TPA: DUF885 domain-containing protein [Candidatus Limnocylindrales bacterium]|nr:DUF885 domain-containing protein [Candidatus Limnocylindrales bacterium]